MDREQRLKYERIVLGTMVESPKHIPEVFDHLNGVQVFTSAATRTLYNILFDMYQHGKPVDSVTIMSELQEDAGRRSLTKEQLELFQAELVFCIQSATWNLEKCLYSVDQLNLEKRKDQLEALLSSNLRRLEKEGNASATDVINQTEEGLFAITAEDQGKEYKTYLDQIRETTEQLERNMLNRGLIGLPTGIEKLDSVTGGLQDGSLIVVAGRPGMGKTALALKIALTSLEMGHKVHFVSREMTYMEVIKRLVAIRTDSLSMSPLFTRPMSDNEINIWHKEIRHVEDFNLVIDEKSITIAEVILEAKKQVRNGCRLIIIDYLQLMRASKGYDVRVGVTEITRELKQLAKSLDVPIVLLSQLSRSVESRGGSKIPMLSDLKESGSIEEDANMVMLLYRPEYYEMEQFPDGEDSAGLCDIDIAKNRSGRCGMVRVGYNGSHVRFHDRLDVFG